MKIQVHINEPEMKVYETFDGANAEDIVAGIKKRIAKELNFAMRLAVGAMSNTMFAQEVVKQYNQSKKTSLPIPESCEDFLKLAQEQGIATVVED